jgi:hypothetical protein
MNHEIRDRFLHVGAARNANESRAHGPFEMNPRAWRLAAKSDREIGIDRRVQTRRTREHTRFKAATACRTLAVSGVVFSVGANARVWGYTGGTTGGCAILMDYLLVGEPAIGDRVVPILATKSPTYPIVDLAWVPEDTPESDLPEGFSFSRQRPFRRVPRVRTSEASICCSCKSRGPSCGRANPLRLV